MAGYLIERSCTDCGAPRGEPCRSQRRGVRNGEPLKGYHDSRKRPADLLAAEDARRLRLRSNEPGTCLWCGKTIPNRYSEPFDAYFCTGRCMEAFGWHAANNGYRFVDREHEAAAILAQRRETAHG